VAPTFVPTTLPPTLSFPPLNMHPQTLYASSAQHLPFFGLPQHFPQAFPQQFQQQPPFTFPLAFSHLPSLSSTLATSS
jgi:hypothetical protein